jgi:hypothetical protein
MFNFKIWFSINIPKIYTVLIKILVYKCVSKSKYNLKELKWLRVQFAHLWKCLPTG